MQEPAAFGLILQFTYALASPKPSDALVVVIVNCCCVSGRTHKHKPLTKQQSPTESLWQATHADLPTSDRWAIEWDLD